MGSVRHKNCGHPTDRRMPVGGPAWIRPEPSGQGPTHGSWWARLDSNQGPTDYESAALTAELRALQGKHTTAGGCRKDCCPSPAMRTSKIRVSGFIPIDMSGSKPDTPWLSEIDPLILHLDHDHAVCRHSGGEVTLEHAQVLPGPQIAYGGGVAHSDLAEQHRDRHRR